MTVSVVRIAIIVHYITVQ